MKRKARLGQLLEKKKQPRLELSIDGAESLWTLASKELGLSLSELEEEAVRVREPDVLQLPALEAVRLGELIPDWHTKKTRSYKLSAKVVVVCPSAIRSVDVCRSAAALSCVD
jgi:hypothetical protein